MMLFRRRRNDAFHMPRRRARDARRSRIANRIALSATLGPVVAPPSTPPIPSTITFTEENDAPANVYSEQELAATREKHVSSDQPLHRFWLSSDLEIPLAALQSVDGYAGHVVHHSRGTVFVEEIVKPGSLVLPLYISSALPVYTEAEIRALFRQVCQQIQVLHNFQTAHRNIHLNHLVVGQTGHTRLRGFQHAVVLNQQSSSTAEYYTEAPLAENRPYDWFAFRAPELEDDGRHGTAVDIWSAGICLYMLLTGLPPFRGSGRELRRQKMNAELADYDIVLPSQAAQDLVNRMVTVDPEDRLTIDEVLEHEWLRDQSASANHHYSGHDLSLSQAFLQDWGRKKSQQAADSAQTSHRHHHTDPPSERRRISPSGIQ